MSPASHALTVDAWFSLNREWSRLNNASQGQAPRSAFTVLVSRKGEGRCARFRVDTCTHTHTHPTVLVSRRGKGIVHVQGWCTHAHLHTHPPPA